MTEKEFIQACNDKKIKKIVRQAKAEAYKEYGTKVKENHFNYFNFIFSKPAFDKVTDDITKELTEKLEVKPCQIDLFGNEVKYIPKPSNKVKRNWENAFQRWSNNKGITSPTEHYGKCGYGSMCDYCEDNTYGRPCVRALNEMCREKRLTINYDKRNFEDIWGGEF